MADSDSEEQDAAPAVPDDQKAAFKAALDRKNSAAQRRSGHLDGDNNVVGSSHAAATKRVFRRKSGG